MVKGDGRWGEEQGREVGVLWGDLPELNHKVGVEGRDGLKMTRRKRGDDWWGDVLEKAERVGA